MGKYPKDRRGTPQRRTSFANDGFPPVPPITGVTPWVRQKISGAQNLSGWSESPPAHWGLTLWKIVSGAAPQPRLALPNQFIGAESWREAQGPPLQRDYFHISRLESCSLIRPLRGHLPPGEGFRAATWGRPYGRKQAGSVGSEPTGAVVEPQQRQFLQAQGPVARRELRPTTQILRAGNIAQPLSSASPVMGSGVQRLGAPERCSSEQTPAAFW